MTGTRQPCRHPRANHQHGTYLAWKKDGCRCQPCTTAGHRQEKTQRFRRETGRSTYVDAAPAREHLNMLLATLTIGQIEARTGLSRTLLKVLAGTFPGRPPSRRITRTTEQAILAVTASHVDDRDHDCLVDPTGSRRRLQALMAIGWPGRYLVDRLGWSARTLWILVHSPTVIRAHTRAQVTALYDELWDQAPPPSRGVTMARNAARRHGYAPPLAWDDDDIDDPNATPHGAQTRSRRTALPDRIEDLLTIEPDIRLHAAAHRLGVQPDTIWTTLKRTGRQDIYTRLTRPDDAPLHRSA